MHDLKNILLAWLSAAPTFMAIDQGNLLTIVSAIILPTIFFLLGKAVDVAVQVYFRKKAETRPVGSVFFQYKDTLPTARVSALKEQR